jgi:cytochrome c oxidase cbb3-type subunit 2
MRSTATTIIVLLYALAPSAEVGADESKALRYGRADYQRYCVSCHGYAGDGHGSSAHRFDNAATDFTLGVYKCRSTPTGTLPTDADLRRSIRDGLFDTGMPSFVAVGSLQIDDMVAVLKTFAARFATQPAAQPIAVPPEPRRDPASIARGAQIYDRMKCGNCHGARGRGGGAGTANLRNEDGSEAHVTDLARGFKCGNKPARIYTTLMTGLDGTPMSSYAETLTPEEAWDLVHFVQSLGG